MKAAWQAMKAAQLEHAEFRRALQNKIGAELRVMYEHVVNQRPSTRLLDLLSRLDEGKKPDLGTGSELKEGTRRPHG
ncbi:MAG TPA: hypothetical protein VIY07_06460 [Pseudolabrys sp.]